MAPTFDPSNRNRRRIRTEPEFRTDALRTFAGPAGRPRVSGRVPGRRRSSAAEFPEVAQLPARADLPDPLVMLDGQPVTSPEQWTGAAVPS